MATPGLRFICRKSLTPPAASAVDYPLSARMDEMDCVAVFDDVLVPWERFFIYRNPRLVANITEAGPGHTLVQSAIKDLAKAEFLLGLAYNLAESINVLQFPNVQNNIREMITVTEMVRAAAARTSARMIRCSARRHARPPAQRHRAGRPRKLPRLGPAAPRSCAPSAPAAIVTLPPITTCAARGDRHRALLTGAAIPADRQEGRPPLVHGDGSRTARALRAPADHPWSRWSVATYADSVEDRARRRRAPSATQVATHDGSSPGRIVVQPAGCGYGAHHGRVACRIESQDRRRDVDPTPPRGRRALPDHALPAPGALPAGSRRARRPADGAVHGVRFHNLRRSLRARVLRAGPSVSRGRFVLRHRPAQRARVVARSSRFAC